jgi:hydroxypyruvate reductase
MPDLRTSTRAIFEQALQSCSIQRALDRKLPITTDANGSRLVLSGRDPDGHDIVPLDGLGRVRIVSAGKAGAAMLDSLLSRLSLPPSCDLRGVLIAPERPLNLPPAFQFFPGGHPVPNAASFAGASAALCMLRDVGLSSPQDALCIFLISGGASAMMELPLDPSISLDDAIAFHRALVHSGASIVEINCVRKHFSAVKGGRLALAAGSAHKFSLLVSDVPPAHLDALASGPSVADPSTVAQCREIIVRFSLMEQFPASVRDFFLSPDLPETPKPGDLVSPCCKLLDSDDLAEAARNHAASLGFHAVIDNTCDDWSYNAAADYLLNRLRQLRREHPSTCLLSTGEVTVRVPDLPAPAHVPGSDTNGPVPHCGGRNQHFALYLATQIRPDDGPLAVLSAGSDGIDGNSLAAGAIVNQHTLDNAHQLAAAHRVLEAFDSSSLLKALGATIVTGPTGQNLRDLRILLADTNS